MSDNTVIAIGIVCFFLLASIMLLSGAPFEERRICYEAQVKTTIDLKCNQ